MPDSRHWPKPLAREAGRAGGQPDAARDERIARPRFVIAPAIARRAIALLLDQGLITTVSQRGSYVL